MEIGSQEWSALIEAGARTFGVVLQPAQLALMARHALQVLAWNRVTNLTSVTEPAAMACNHYLDSLAAAAFIPPAGALLDIGSGAGFPGIPLHLVCPGLETTLIDASRKKVSFLRQVIRELKLRRISALHVRAEQLAGRGADALRFSVVVSRALGRTGFFLRMTLPLLADDGRILAMKGRMAAEEVSALERSARSGEFGAALCLRRHGYRVPGLSSERSILVFERIGG